MQAFCTQLLDVLEDALSGAQAWGQDSWHRVQQTADTSDCSCAGAPRQVRPWGGRWVTADYNVSSCKAFIKSHLLVTRVI